MNISYLRGIVLLVILLVLSSCVRNKTLEESVQENVLDDINLVPEWLNMNVDEAFPNDSLNVWVPTNNFQTSSLIRVPRFPRVFSEMEIQNNPALNDFAISPIKPNQNLTLSGVRNEQISAQIAFGAKQKLNNVKVEVNDLVDGKGNVIDKTKIQIRYVRYLQVERSRSEYVWSPKLEEIIGEGVSGNMFPNVVADPLLDLDFVTIPAYRAQPVWITVYIPKDTNYGIYKGVLKISGDEFNTLSYNINVRVLPQEIPDPINYSFLLEMWVNPSAIADYYKLEHWSEQHWKMIEMYLKEYASRGGKNVTATITNEPWHKPWIGGATKSQIAFGYKSMVKWIKDKQGIWKFDYSVLDKYIKLCDKVGVNGDINAFSMAPFHTSQKIQYFDAQEGDTKILEIKILDDAYAEIWSVFLKSFREHLIDEKLSERVYLAFDERPESEMQVIRKVIKRSAPEFLDRIVISGHPEVGEHSDNFSISYMFFPNQPLEKDAKVEVLPTIDNRRLQGKSTTFYLCAEPAHPNTLTYSPAIEGQMIPWLALKYNTDGYLRWAFNNWTEDPFHKPVFIHAQGDDYQLYPGKTGPVSSIRWELLKEGIEDYELFKIVEEKGIVSDKNLAEAIELATRNQDGRFKHSNDFYKARNLILNNE